LTVNLFLLKRFLCATNCKAILGLAFLSVLPACDSPTTVSDRDTPDYNVVLISIDTLRADHLGVYGYDKNTSPNIDALAKDSVLFKQSIAHGPSTLISHASIFTSQIPAHHGASVTANTPVAKGLPVMAELLQEAGLSTVSFNDGGQLSAVYGLGRGFDLYNSDSARVSRFSDKIIFTIL
jgi:glucan phosphoethanolaminetransferase (alkaline phosphatase superfamily)